MHIKGDKRNKLAVNSCIGANLKNYLEAIGYCKKDESGHITFNIPKELPLFPQMSNNPKLQDLTKPISTKNLHKMWKSYAKKAKIERAKI